MAEIDFEKIRSDSVQAVTKSIPQDAYGKTLILAAEAASQVTMKMLMEYHAACTHSQVD